MSTNGLREKPKQTGRIIAAVAAIIWAGVIFALSSIPGGDFIPHPNALNVVAHFCEYLLLSVLIALAFNSPDRAFWKTALIALIITSLYGASDEIHQLFTAGRSSDPLDWVTDTVGAFLGAAATIWILSARKVKQSRARDAQKKIQH
jgi:VanZ family protein